jgi:hypothetical protein
MADQLVHLKGSVPENNHAYVSPATETDSGPLPARSVLVARPLRESQGSVIPVLPSATPILMRIVRNSRKNGTGAAQPMPIRHGTFRSLCQMASHLVTKAVAAFGPAEPREWLAEPGNSI